MTKINKTEAKTLDIVKKTGFTYYGDVQFRTFNQAKRCIDGLVRKGLLVKVGDEFKGA